MSRTVGTLTWSGPRVKVTISGSKASFELEGLVDTGFTGFILVPIATAVPLGLELDGIEEYVTADGTRQDWPTATATVEFGSQLVEKSVTLAYTGNELLLGLGFLRSFHQSLVVHRDQIILIDHADLDASLAGLH